VLAAMLGAVSGLYDKYLMASPSAGGVGLDRMIVQSWYNFYQMGMMGVVLLIAIFKPFARFRGGKPLFPQSKFHWDWAIILISVFLSAADFVYFYSLSMPGAMISIVSMVRRGSVIVSFMSGAIFFHEKNLKAKAFDLLLVLLGMVFLYIGSH
jgi:drug/metabolite transporter (DMT)-like permease